MNRATRDTKYEWNVIGGEMVSVKQSFKFY